MLKMGEKTHMPQENGMVKPPAEQLPDQDMPSEGDEDNDEIDDMTPEEFQMLDNQLDALNTALDTIEQKNDSIHAELLQLLQSNREIRKQLQESKASANSSSNSENSPQPE